MQSKVADQIARERARRIAAMTPAERVTLAERLGSEGIASYMAAHGVDRRTAITRIKATRRLGRRPSRCASANEY